MLLTVVTASAAGFDLALSHRAIVSARARLVCSSSSTPDGGSNDEGLLSPSEMERLRSRIQKIQERGIATPSQKLFELATKESPSALMRDFFATASPQVSQAMCVAHLAVSMPLMACHCAPCFKVHSLL